MTKKKEESNEQIIPEAALKGDKCISCKRSIANDIASVRFPCPSCSKYMILRCSNCRKIVAKYKCPLCGFEGPN